MPVYLVRSTLPGAAAGDLQAAADRAAHVTTRMGLEGFRIRYLQSTYVPVDGWFGCLYEADSSRDVLLASERAAIPFDEVVEAVPYIAGPSIATPQHRWEPS
jgi:hypothetical protein